MDQPQYQIVTDDGTVNTIIEHDDIQYYTDFSPTAGAPSTTRVQYVIQQPDDNNYSNQILIQEHPQMEQQQQVIQYHHVQPAQPTLTQPVHYVSFQMAPQQIQQVQQQPVASTQLSQASNQQPMTQVSPQQQMVQVNQVNSQQQISQVQAPVQQQQQRTYVQMPPQMQNSQQTQPAEIERQQQNRQIQSHMAPEQNNTIYNQQPQSNEMVQLSDGRLMTLAEFQQYQINQHNARQQQLQQQAKQATPVQQQQPTNQQQHMVHQQVQSMQPQQLQQQQRIMQQQQQPQMVMQRSMIQQQNAAMMGNRTTNSTMYASDQTQVEPQSQMRTVQRPTMVVAPLNHTQINQQQQQQQQRPVGMNMLVNRQQMAQQRAPPPLNVTGVNGNLARGRMFQQEMTPGNKVATQQQRTMGVPQARNMPMNTAAQYQQAQPAQQANDTMNVSPSQPSPAQMQQNFYNNNAARGGAARGRANRGGVRNNARARARGGANACAPPPPVPSPQQPQQLMSSRMPEPVEEHRQTAKMLVVLENGEQRLITFSLPKEQCSIRELLEQVLVQVNVNYEPGRSNIRCVRNPDADIEYMVTFCSENDPRSIDAPQNVNNGFNMVNMPQQQPYNSMMNQMNEPAQHQMQMNRLAAPPPNHMSSFQQSFCANLPNFNSANAPAANNQLQQINAAHALPPTPTPVVPEPTPQVKAPEPKVNDPPPDQTVVKEEETPKFVEGKLAVCRYCGYCSLDFNKCQRCKRKLENPKAIDREEGTNSNNNSNKKKDLVAEMRLLKAHSSPAIELKTLVGNSAILVTKTTKRRNRGVRTNDVEPEVLTLSSDEEGDEKKKSSHPVVSRESLGLSEFEPFIKKEEFENVAFEPIDKVNSEKLMSSLNENVYLTVRSLRIGTYKCVPSAQHAFITSTCIELHVPRKTDKSNVTLRLEHKNILNILVHFGKQLPIIFMYILPLAARSIREVLQMKETPVDKDYYYNPISQESALYRRIVIIVEEFTPESMRVFKEFYKHRIEELDLNTANDVLLKTCGDDKRRAEFSVEKKDDMSMVRHASNMSLGLSDADVKTLLRYPKEGKGAITITTMDYQCLARDQFLNDVIIEFYLKYLLEELVDEERRKNYYIYTTFFYKRLTSKPNKKNRFLESYESDPNISAAERRFLRIKRWTRNVNVFDKDFLFVPINESSHWYLAVICFPGLNEPRRISDNEPIKIENKPHTSAKTKQKVDLPTVPVMGDDDGSDRDEADASDSEIEQSDTDDDDSSKDAKVKEPVKQPCILILDSLSNGISRSRVVATLRDYLTFEFKEKYSQTKKFDKWNMKGHSPKVPQQTNFTDCGLYLLQFVEAFIQNPIKDFNIPMKNLKGWFEENTVTKKREDISNIIKEKMVGEKKDIKIVPNIPFPTKNGVVLEQEYHDYDDDDDDEEFGDDETFDEDFDELEDEEIDDEEDEELLDIHMSQLKKNQSPKMKRKSNELNTKATKRIRRTVAASSKMKDQTSSTPSAATNTAENTSNTTNDEAESSTELSGAVLAANSDTSSSPTHSGSVNRGEAMSYLKSKRINRHNSGVISSKLSDSEISNSSSEAPNQTVSNSVKLVAKNVEL